MDNQNENPPESQDIDGDGYTDDVDAFPNDSSEWIDTDDDGIGDNGDAFPDDSTQWADRDGDGYGDNPDGNNPDLFPDNPNLWEDRTNTVLTQNGIDYICEKFDDGSFCCVKEGISWSYLDIEGTTHSETGGTADAVKRLILIGTVTITNPRNEIITYETLKSVNDGQDISLQDAETIRQHDEPSEDQWCYIFQHSLTQNGIDYICQNFGDDNYCCVKSGLSWYYTVGGVDYPETGATAQIVSRLASGLIDSLTMTNPARGTFIQTDLNTANGGTVSLIDAKAITYHDESFEDQWCLIL